MWCFSNCGKYRVEPSTQEFLALSPFSPASGYHTARCPMPADQVSHRSCGPSKETFFFPLEEEETLPSTLVLIELMRTNHNVKRGISIPISNKCDDSGAWWAHSRADAAKSCTGFQARCKIGSEFQERICFPGSWQVCVTRQEPIRP